MAFLQVVTRTFLERPAALRRNQASLAALLDPDWEQALLIDDVGRGVSWANTNLATVRATGDWVWVLDDDDECALPGLVGALKVIAVERECGVVVMRAAHGAFGILPHDEHWKQRPVLNDCGWSNFFVRQAVWEQHRPVLAEFAFYAADHAYAAHLWDQGVRFHWHDAVAMRYPQANKGRGE